MRFRNVIRMSEEDWLKLLPDRVKKIFILCSMLIPGIWIVLLVLIILTGYQFWKAFLITCFIMGTGCVLIGICLTTVFFCLRIEVIEEVIE